MTICVYITSLFQSASFLSLYEVISLLSKQFNAFKAYILLLHVFLTRYSNTDACAGYTFYPLSTPFLGRSSVAPKINLQHSLSTLSCFQLHYLSWQSPFLSTLQHCMSSSNRRLVIFLLSMLTFLSRSSAASDIIRSQKMLKTMGDRKHHCLTPTVVLNHFPMLHSSGLHL